MKVLIVDDEKPARDRLTRMVEKLPGYQIVGYASNGNEALQLAESSAADIVLMDIRMPGLDGIQAARHLSGLAQPPAVIFTTAYADHALEAFETHAVDYLLKPVKQDRLQQSLEAARKPTRAQVEENTEVLASIEPRRHICARVRGNLVLVNIENIYYFHAEQKYVTVRHKEGELLIEDALKSLETEFAEKFVRIHRNALINLKYIAGMVTHNDSQHVSVKEIDDTLEISRRHLAAIRKIIKNL
ncbi:MAG: LytTR family DNA-binding domain-containing protein [Gammaproteobacteria bacterium]|nr:LytTR family DNA-binding domain-containing protein [Gammaproteobacteria bacterium]